MSSTCPVSPSTLTSREDDEKEEANDAYSSSSTIMRRPEFMVLPLRCVASAWGVTHGKA